MSHPSAPPTIPAPIRSALRKAYRLARARFGHQHWWPADTPFEVCVGAILTQNTAWSNVERALANLKNAGLLNPRRLHALPLPELARHLRPAGYFNVKARRLRAFLEALVNDYGGDLKRMLSGPTQEVRARLLHIPGIGPETADSMLLYAGGHAVFVVDAYTRRIFGRHGWYVGSPVWSDTDFYSSGKPGGPALGTPLALSAGPEPGLSYESLQQLCTTALNHKRGAARLDYWQDYHAQLVMIGKHYCRTRNPLCHQCPLRPLLPPRQPGTPLSK